MRKKPQQNSTTIDYIGEGERLTLWGKTSKKHIKVKLRGKVFHKPWVKVQTLYNTSGWVYAGAVQKRKVALKPKLLLPGTYSSHLIKAKSDTSYLVVIKKKNHYSLLARKIKIQNFRHPQNYPGLRTGKKVSLPQVKGKAIFMVKGLNIKPQKLLISRSYSPWYRNKWLKIPSITGKPYYLLKTRTDKKNSFQYKVILRKGNIKQVLYTDQDIIAPDSQRHATLLWVGDLNADGSLDFLIDHSRYVGGKPTLYISTNHDKNLLVKPIAEFTFDGC
ncbi:MAG: hypothetical protein AAF518_19825 [Spirochaetota bacterium]